MGSGVSNGVVRAAAEKYEPFMITRHTVDLCQAYNKFYFERRILGEEPAVMAARLALTKCAATVIRSGLALIGLKAPEQM